MVGRRDTRVSSRISAEGGDQAAREFEKFADRGDRAMQRLHDATKEPTKGLKALDSASGGAQKGLRAMGDSAALITGPLGGVASRLSGVATILGRVGVAGAAAAVVIGGLTFGLSKGVAAGNEYEKQMFRVEGVLNATGAASGRTVKQIDTLALSIGRGTLASRQGAREASAALLTFRSISEETFDRTLRVAQDLAAVLGSDLRSQVLQLGKALEDPTLGLTALRRVGVSFSESQQTLIKSLVASGEQLKAQSVLLTEIEKQVGGAGAREAGGLAGAFDTLGENVGTFFERLSENTGVLAGATSLLQSFADAAGAAADAIERTPQERLGPATERVNVSRDQLAARRRLIEAGAVPDNLATRETLSRLEAALANATAARQAILREIAAEREAGEQAAILADQARRQRADEFRQRETDRRAKFPFAPRALDARTRAAGVAGERESFDGLAKLIGEQNIADVKRQRALEELLVGLERQAELAGLTREERQVELEVIKAQKAANRDLTDAQRGRLEAAVTARQEQEKAQEAARKAAAETQRVWETAADGIQNSLAEAFVGGLGSGLELLKRTAGNLLSGFVFKPGGLLGGLNPAAQGGASSGASFGGFNVGSLFNTGGFSLGGGLSNLSSLGGSVAGLFGFGGTGGAAAAAGVAPTAGGLTNAGTAGLSQGLSSALGGGLAFAAPFALSLLSGQGVGQASVSGLGSLAGLAFGGPVGAAIGGFAGNLLGGALFGGDKQKPRASGLVGFEDGGLAVLRAQRQDGGDEQSGRDLAQVTVDALEDFRKLAGAGLNTGFSGARGTGTLGLIQVKQTDDGPRFRFRRGLKPGGELGSFRTAEAAIDAFIGDAAAAGALTGLPGAIADVAGAEGAGEAARLLGVRRGVDDRIAALDGRGLVTALRNVGETFGDLTEDARKAGIDLAKIERLKQSEIVGIVTRASDEQIAAVGRISDASTRAAFRAGRRARSAIGAASDLSRRFNATAALSGFDDVLRFGAGSPLRATDQLADARQRFRSLASRAQGDDLAALEALPAAQATLLELSERVNGRAGAFAVDFADVRSLNRQLGVQSDDGSLQSTQEKANTLLQQVVDEVGAGGANAAKLDEVIAKLTDLADGLTGTLAAEFRQLADQIRLTL